MNFIHACTCPLFCLLYDNDMVRWIIRFLQSSKNFYETKLVPASDTLLFFMFVSQLVSVTQ